MQYNSSRKNNQAIISNVKMYGKLSVVMGLTWLLGFSMKYSVILKFIYLVVNNLQGKFSSRNIYKRNLVLCNEIVNKVQL